MVPPLFRGLRPPLFRTFRLRMLRRFRHSTPYTQTRRMSFTRCTAETLQPNGLLSARCKRGTASASRSLRRKRRSFLSLSHTLFRADHHTPVKIAALQAQNQHLRRGKVCCARDVICVAQVTRRRQRSFLQSLKNVQKSTARSGRRGRISTGLLLRSDRMIL